MSQEKPVVAPKGPEQAAKDVRSAADNGKGITEEVNAAMASHTINTKETRLQLSAALEANGTLPSLIIENLRPADASGVSKDDLTARAKGDPSRADTLAAAATLDRFNELDIDHDNKITSDEANRWRQAQQSKPEQVRYPDGSVLEAQTDGSYLLTPAEGDPVAVKSDDVRPDGSRVLAREGGQPTRILRPDGSELNMSQAADGKMRLSSITRPDGSQLNITYDKEGKPRSVTDGPTFNRRAIGSSGDQITVDEKTGAVSVVKAKGTRIDVDSDSTSREYGTDGTLQKLKDSQGNESKYTYQDGKLINVKRTNGPDITEPFRGSLSVDEKGNVTARGADGRQTLHKVDCSVVNSEPDGKGGMRVTDITYRDQSSQHFTYTGDTMTGYTDVDGVEHTSTDGKTWTSAEGKREFQISVAPDGTTRTTHPGGRIDVSRTDGTGTQQQIERSTAVPALRPNPHESHAGAPGKDNVITKNTPNGSIEYNYPAKKDEAQVTITWKDPNGVEREQLHQDPSKDGSGQWWRSYTGADGQRINERISNVQQTNDGYTFVDEQGNKIDQGNDGRRTKTAPNGDYVRYDHEGKPEEINHQGNGGGTETLYKTELGWVRRSGTKTEDMAVEPVDSVLVNPDGSYSFQSRDHQRRTVQHADGRRVDEDLSKGGKTSYNWRADGGIDSVVHTGTDGKTETLKSDMDGNWKVVLPDGTEIDAKVKMDAARGTIEYEAGDRHVIKNADGSRVEHVIVGGQMKPTKIARPDGLRYDIKYGDDGSIAGIDLHIPGRAARPEEALLGDTVPERVDKWEPTGKPGEMRRSDGVVATDLQYDSRGNFSFTYVTADGIKVRHVDRADGSEENTPI